jgi:murein L,D-transpeptidase YcbB/YkuD
MRKQLELKNGYKPLKTANTILLTFMFLIVLTLAIVTAKGASKPPSLTGSETELSVEIKRQLNEGGLALNYPGSTKYFYTQRMFGPNWVLSNDDGKQTWAAMLMIDCVKQFGLIHNDYHPQELLYDRLHNILERSNTVSIPQQARFDIMLTDAMLTFINHLHYGKFNPEYPASKIDEGKLDDDKLMDFKATDLLAKATGDKDFMQVIISAQPQDATYQQLQNYMHLVAGIYIDDCYEFPEANIRKMAINMERLRWAAIDSSNCIQINIPSYLLKFYHAGVIDTFKVIVGKAQNPTPTLQSAIRYFTTAPEWRVPAKIFADELLPKAIEDSNYLAKNHYSIYDDQELLIQPDKSSLIKIKEDPGKYYVRQSAGGDNALGLIVFRFPNMYDVYLHDTPNKNLFNNDERALSHGCIRVEHAELLASKLLVNDGTANKVRALRGSINATQTKTFNLKKAVPIKVTYLTCEMKEGELVIYKDIYNLDKDMEAAIYGVIQPISMK